MRRSFIAVNCQSNMQIHQHTDILLAKYPIITDQISKPALRVVLSELEAVLAAGVYGDVAEFGCYKGTTTLFMRRLMDCYGQTNLRRLYAYDSFEGLPAKTNLDNSGVGEEFREGELLISKKQLLTEFNKAHLQPPIVYKGWFSELSSERLPHTIAFAFLDGDFYESIYDSLSLVWPRLVTGGVITIDDYQRAALPGVERAVEGFFKHKSVAIHHVHNIAVVTHR